MCVCVCGEREGGMVKVSEYGECSCDGMGVMVSVFGCIGGEGKVWELWCGCLSIMRVRVKNVWVMERVSVYSEGERVGVMVRVSEYIKSEGWVL